MLFTLFICDMIHFQKKHSHLFQGQTLFFMYIIVFDKNAVNFFQAKLLVINTLLLKITWASCTFLCLKK